ncbi:hypothetical protein E5D01_22890 [Escherichia coli]|nr:hypothetical protein [Escherichia coli]
MWLYACCGLLCPAYPQHFVHGSVDKILGYSSRFPRNVKTAAPETQRVMFFKNQDLFQAPAIRIYVFCQSSGWQVMRTQEQKEENTGERQTQI